MNNIVLRKRTIFVLVITVLTMITEIFFGITTHSMGLTADGFHMGTHAVAFIITLIVCQFAVKYSDKEEKLNAIGGYTSAMLLGVTALGIIYESFERCFNPLVISFKEAILVASLGLCVNLICAFIMHGKDSFHTHEHCCSHDHHEKEQDDCNVNHNLNFKAAYFHIIADAFTSVLAICALLLGKYLGLNIIDPIIGIIGGIIIAKWAYDLIKASLHILLEL